MIKDFDDLEVYQLSMKLTRWIYDLTTKFPVEEKDNLISQLRRAGTSIGANIAEGYGRYHYKENQQFCLYARGSLSECKHFVLFAHDKNYISSEEKDKFIQEYTRLKVKLNNYIKSIGSKKININNA